MHQSATGLEVIRTTQLTLQIAHQGDRRRYRQCRRGAEILETLTTPSEYPFDEATVRSTSSRPIDDNPIGFNARGRTTWRLTKVLGIVFQARYGLATIGIAQEGGEEIELDAGGFLAGGGIRLSF